MIITVKTQETGYLVMMSLAFAAADLAGRFDVRQEVDSV